MEGPSTIGTIASLVAAAAVGGVGQYNKYQTDKTIQIQASHLTAVIMQVAEQEKRIRQLETLQVSAPQPKNQRGSTDPQLTQRVALLEAGNLIVEQRLEELEGNVYDIQQSYVPTPVHIPVSRAPKQQPAPRTKPASLPPAPAKKRPAPPKPQQLTPHRPPVQRKQQPPPPPEPVYDEETGDEEDDEFVDDDTALNSVRN